MKRCGKRCKNGKKCKNSVNCRHHFKGELHMVGRNKKGKIVRMSYCGPGTNLKAREKIGSKPINKVDAVCKTHDYAYQRIGQAKISKNEKKKQVRQADRDMIKSLKSIRGWESTIARLAIKGKIGLETIGVSKRLKFVE